MSRRALAVCVVAALCGVPDAAFAAGAPVATASAQARSKAQNLFAKGKKEFELGRFDLALGTFRESYDTVASPNSHLYEARCMIMLGRHAEAYRELGMVVHEAEAVEAIDAKYGDTRRAAVAERDDLARKIGLVVVRVAGAPQGTSLRVAGELVPESAWAAPIAVTPGAIEVVLEAPGHPAQRRQALVGAGERKELALGWGAPTPAPGAVAAPRESPEPPAADPASEDRKRRTMRTAAYVAGGVGAAGLLTFAIAGSLARSKYNTLQDECAGPCPPSRQDDIDAGRRDQTIANVGVVVGLVGIGAGATLWVLSRKKGPAEPRASATRLSADLVGGPSWVGIHGVLP